MRCRWKFTHLGIMSDFAWNWFRAGQRITAYMEKLTDSLLRKNMRPLQFICQSLHCVPVKNARLLKSDYAMALV